MGSRWPPRRTAPEVPSAPEDAAQSPTGTAAPTVCTVPPPLLIAHLLLPSRLWSRWLPRRIVPEVPSVPEDAAQNPTGTAALMACTALPPLLTVFVAAKQTLIKMAAKKDCPGGTECPGGCCPEPNWYCCPDGMYCAATAADCPFVAAKQTLIKMAAKKDCPGGTECPGGCCPEPNWYCCPD